MPETASARERRSGSLHTYEYAHLVMAYAHAYAADGQLEEAIAECERGLEINPNSSILYSNVGAYLGALGITSG